MVPDLRTDRFEWSGHYLVDPWAADDPDARSHPRGGLVDLNCYPRLRAYLEANGKAFRGRKRHLTSWYQTIDRVDHKMTPLPKLLVPDIRLTAAPGIRERRLLPASQRLLRGFKRVAARCARWAASIAVR